MTPSSYLPETQQAPMEGKEVQVSFNYLVRLRQWLGAREHSEQGQLGHLCGYWSDCGGRERLGSLRPEMFGRQMPKPRSLCWREEARKRAFQPAFLGEVPCDHSCSVLPRDTACSPSSHLSLWVNLITLNWEQPNHVRLWLTPSCPFTHWGAGLGTSWFA